MIDSFINQVVKVVNKFNQLEKKPVDLGTGEQLYPSEIHVIEAVGLKPGLTVTEVGNRLGITKGAVSQVVSKLSQKGYVTKTRNAAFGKEILLFLTSKGETAFQGHQDLHGKMDQELVGLIEAVPADQLQQFREMLVLVEKHIDKYIDMD